MKRIIQYSPCFLLALLWTTLVEAQSLTDESTYVEKRAPSGFQGMRGKKFDTYLNDMNSDWTRASELIDKRAPSMGFQGMRGKKLYENNYRNIYQYKRIPMGFHGMRGKKNYEFPSNPDDIPNDNTQQDYPSSINWNVETNLLPDIEDNYVDVYHKRAPIMGFQGVRGKKTIEQQEMKRAPAGFFGVRGKKQPFGQSGFFGMRGKKYPLEFRGKFVGVRGKKLLTSNRDEDEVKNLLLLKDPIIVGGDGQNPENTTEFNNNLNHLMIHLLQQQQQQQQQHADDGDDSNEIVWTKRKMQGFVGMRGKKDSSTENN